MTTILDTIEQRAAARIAGRFFISGSSFMPRVGNPVTCKAYVAREQDLQPIGYDQVADIKKKAVVYLKSEIGDSIMEPEAYFTISGVKYFVESTSDNDSNILGRVIVRDEN
jgi:hypothetical protein